MAGFRKEKDSLGTVDVPAGAYYGAQTARALENFPISGMLTYPQMIRAAGMIKYAAAEANRKLGLLNEERAERFCKQRRRSSKASGTPSLWSMSFRLEPASAST